MFCGRLLPRVSLDAIAEGRVDVDVGSNVGVQRFGTSSVAFIRCNQ